MYDPNFRKTSYKFCLYENIRKYKKSIYNIYASSTYPFHYHIIL